MLQRVFRKNLIEEDLVSNVNMYDVKTVKGYQSFLIDTLFYDYCITPCKTYMLETSSFNL